MMTDVDVDNDAVPRDTTTDSASKVPKSLHHKNVSWGATPSSPPMHEIGPSSPRDDLDLSSNISDPVLQAAMSGRSLMNGSRKALAGMNELSNEAVS